MFELSVWEGVGKRVGRRHLDAEGGAVGGDGEGECADWRRLRRHLGSVPLHVGEEDSLLLSALALDLARDGDAARRGRELGGDLGALAWSRRV